MELPDVVIVAEQYHAGMLEARQTNGQKSWVSDEGEELMVNWDDLPESGRAQMCAEVQAVYDAINIVTDEGEPEEDDTEVDRDAEDEPEEDEAVVTDEEGNPVQPQVT